MKCSSQPSALGSKVSPPINPHGFFPVRERFLSYRFQLSKFLNCMNVEVEKLPNCITTLRVEVPGEKVVDAYEDATSQYARHASIPGYRAGKAPRTVIANRFKKQIREEVEKKLLSESYREAVAEKELRVLQLSEVEDVELDREKGLSFTATVVTAPEFETPNYKALDVKQPDAAVTDADIEEAIENLRGQRADFQDLEGRPLAMEDFVVVDYEGTLDGKPVDEVVPKAGKPLAENKDFWLKMTPDAFFPGFTDHLVGASLDDTRSFDLPVPADFPIDDLQGKTLHYEVTIKGLKQQVLPELDDAFASSVVAGKTMDELRAMARTEIENQKQQAAEDEKRNNIMQQLSAQVECELPEGMVKAETRRILNEIVRENQTRGVADNVLQDHKSDLVETAGRNARERLKGRFILVRIAEEEKIRVSEQDFSQRLMMMAMQYRTTPEKLMKELQENNAVDNVREEILTGKVLDFLVSGDTVADAPVAAGQPA